MATVTEMRTVLRASGLAPPDRGRLSPDWIKEYDKIVADTPSDVEDDYGISEADFRDLPADDEMAEPSIPLKEETRPVRPSEPKRHVRQRLFGASSPKDTSSKAKDKKRQKRITVEHLIGRTWEGLARISQPFSLSVSRCLMIQSPVAGAILEDVVRDTVVDRALQPLARAEEKAEAVIALAGAPILVMAIEQAMALEDQRQQAIRLAFLMPMLDESLRIWLKVAGPKVEIAAKREAEYQEKYGATINQLKAAILFGGVAAEAEADEMAGAAA